MPRRDELFGLLVVAAALSEPTNSDNEAELIIMGPEEDHPERALCRAAFSANAEWVSRLLADSTLPTSVDDRVYLLSTAGL